MTIEREEPGIWAATCDGCGERLVLDTDGNEPQEDAETELLNEHGWTARPVQSQKFETTHGTYKETYAEHDCVDCSDG